MEQVIKWLNSIEGVPVIIEKEIAKLWNGASGNDFEFACSFLDYTSVSTYISSPIIILGDEPLPTGILQRRNDLIFIVRWIYAENEVEVTNFIKNIDFEKEVPLKKQFVSFGKDNKTTGILKVRY